MCALKTYSFVRHWPAAPFLLRDDSNNIHEAFGFALGGNRSLFECCDMKWQRVCWVPFASGALCGRLDLGERSSED